MVDRRQLEPIPRETRDPEAHQYSQLIYVLWKLSSTLILAPGTAVLALWHNFPMLQLGAQLNPSYQGY
jgi:hypothetical protein